MSNEGPDHPGRERLTAYASGRTEEAESVAIEEHLLHCDACCDQVEALPQDPLDFALSQSNASLPETAASVSEPVPPALADHPRYRLIRLLGSGGMGVVYQAEHRLMERPVALKIIHRHWTAEPAAVARFRREVRAAARLSHPNIVIAYDAEQAGDTHFLVMEYVEGTSLAAQVATRGPLPVAEACECARQAALGLQHALERGMVHRDIKPQNLIRTPEGLVKILDFGLAKFVTEFTPASGLTEVGTVMGTPDYLAPEQARDAHAADIRADLYSLGCTLYHLLAGEVPFPAKTSLQKVTAHLERTARPLTELRPDVPAALADVVARLMAKDPAERPKTPAEAARALVPFADAAGRRRRKTHVVFIPTDAPERSAARAKPPGALRPRTLSGHTGRVLCLAFRPDGGRLASGGQDQTVRLWEVASGKECAALPGGAGPVRALAFSPDGKTLASGHDDQAVRLWDLDAGRERLVLRRHTGPVRALAFSPDGKILASTSYDQGIRLWDVAVGEEIGNLREHLDRVLCLVFSPDGNTLVSGGYDRKVILWDMAAGRPNRILAAPGDAVFALALGPDGETLATAYSMVRLWDLDAGVVRESLAGHRGAVPCLAFSPDGRTLASGGMDRTVRCWGMLGGERRRTLLGHKGPVTGVAFSAQGLLASASADQTVRLWEPVAGAGPGEGR
jgi:hypothetical protein